MTTREHMVELIAAEMFRHRLTVNDEGRAACMCGWFAVPLLTSVHRMHTAEAILASCLLATAQINGENIVEARDGVLEDARKRTTAVGLLLADSGDITPMGQRMLQKIWEPAEERA